MFLHATLKKAADVPSSAAFAICCLPKENPGLVTRGKDFAGNSGGSSEPFYGIDANVSLRMGIDLMAGQQAGFIG